MQILQEQISVHVGNTYPALTRGQAYLCPMGIPAYIGKDAGGGAPTVGALGAASAPCSR